MSQYCTKCGTENEDGAKFCKNCGAALVAVQAPVGKVAEHNVKSTDTKSIVQTVIKVVVWIVVAIVAIMIVFFGYFLIKTSSLKSGCENNNAQACYDLATLDGQFIDYDEKSEAANKACRLGSADGCYEIYAYEKACDLKLGKGCYREAVSLMTLAEQKCGGDDMRGQALRSITGYADKDCNNLRLRITSFLKKACDNGYEQGCTSYENWK